MKTCHLSLFAAALLAALPLPADEVTDNLDSAKAFYASGAFSEAIQSLDYASQLIRQKKGEAVVKVLPAAPDGWQAEEGESESAAGAFAGGMVQAKRVYRKGDSAVTIQIQSDSPLLQNVVMLMANPIVLASSGAKLESIKGQKCAVEFKGGATAGSLKTVVDSRYLVEISGSDVRREDLVAFAKAIDFARLAALK